MNGPPAGAGAGQPGADRRRLRRVALLIAAACLVPAVLDAWQWYMQGRLDGGDGGGEVPWAGMAFQAGEWVILGGLTLLVYSLAVRFPLRGPRARRNLAIHAAGALVLCVGWASLGVVLRLLLGILPPEEELLRHSVSWVLFSLPWSVFMYFAILGCLLAFAYFFESKEREALAARLAAQVAEARLGALRMQLHPHFLFNSLNAVAVLVRDGRAAEATRVVEQLSEVLRQVLDESHGGEVPLAEELAFVRNYLAIEEVRFPDRLEVRWRIDPAAEDARVPSFVLQPLVENALRHGVAALSRRSTVDIEAAVEGTELRLAVENDAPGAAQRERAPGRRAGGRGLGLANLRERLATLYGERADLSLGEAEGRVRAEVRLPLSRHAGAEEAGPGEAPA